ncbi:MAG: dolichyl-phosphate-mannose--protein mannosyltransferase, partial [Gammaproteobacteria bacterium]|nr:dolichyl-phosphate-mannose--protein mannosyltransferase [Gammaproteobacteria bacterium]
YFASRTLFNRRCGILAALITSSALLYIAINHMLTMDAGLSFFMTLSLLSFMLGMRQSGTKQCLWLWLAYIAAGLAFLVKGLIGIVFPMMIIGIWIMVLNRWFVLKQMRIISGLALFALVTLPWLILTQRAVPSFFHEFFVIQQFARYATPIEHRHMPLSSYIAVVVLGFFPWTVWIAQTVKFNLPRSWSLRHHSPESIFLLVWAGAITLFFACSHSILIPYLLPIIAPLAILTARYIDDRWDQPLYKSQAISIMTFSILCLILSIGILFVPKFQALSRVDFTYSIIILISISLLSTGLANIWFCYKRLFRLSIISMMILPWILMNLVWVAAPYIVNRSIEPLAVDLKPLIQKNPNAMVVSFRTYYQDLPYYIKQKVTIVAWQDELEYGYETQADAKNWMLDELTFWQLWQGPQLIYAIMNKNDYQALSSYHNMYLIDQTNNDVLISNRKP